MSAITVPESTRYLTSWSDFHQMVFPDATDAQKRWEWCAAQYLWNRGYDPGSIKLAIEHAGTYGTFECCRELSFFDADREACERMLPDAPASDWSRYDGDTWAINN